MDKRRVSLVLGWCFLACGVLGPVWALSAGQMSGPALLAGLCLVPGFLLLKGARRAPDAGTPGEAGAQDDQTAQNAQDAQDAPDGAADLYCPDPARTRVDVHLQDRRQAADLAPRYLEQARQAAAVLNATADPDEFFRQYDYLLGRMVVLAECTKYLRFGGEQPQLTLARLCRQSYRDHVGKAMIDRCCDKARAAGSPQAAAAAFDAAFAPCLDQMSDALRRYQADKARQLADGAEHTETTE